MKRNLGFTLVELAIVISIMAILTTGGLASFVSYSRTQSLQTAATDLTTTLNLAKSRAFSQVKPDQGQCASQTLDGYKVLISVSNNSYEMDVVCSGNVYKIASTKLPANVTFSPNGTTSTFFLFPVISGGVVGSGLVKLSFTGTSLNRTITVDSVGTVK